MFLLSEPILFFSSALENELMSIVMKGQGMQVYPRVASHDGVVAVVIQRGSGCVQGAGTVRISADAVVLAPFGDLFSIFKPVNLHRHKATQSYTSMIARLFSLSAGSG